MNKNVVLSYCSTEMGERCTFKDDDDCSFSFSYKENPGKDVIISVQKEKGTAAASLNIHRKLCMPKLRLQLFGDVYLDSRSLFFCLAARVIGFFGKFP